MSIEDIVEKIQEDNSQINQLLPFLEELSNNFEADKAKKTVLAVTKLARKVESTSAKAFLEDKLYLLYVLISEANFEKFIDLLGKCAKSSSKAKIEFEKEIWEFYLNTEEMEDTEAILNISKTALKDISLLQNVLSKITNYLKTQEIKAESVFNMYNFVICLDGVPEEAKKAYQSAIIQLFRGKVLSSELKEHLLSSVSKVVLNNLDNPLILSDILIVLA